MSSLREMVAARRAAEPSAAAPSLPDLAPRTLQVEPGGCERWLLTWSQFVSAHYHERGDQEQLVLRFAEYEVTVDGRRLACLLADVAAMRLSCVRGQPEAGMAAHHGSAPAIARVQIRALSRPGQPAPGPESSK